MGLQREENRLPVQPIADVRTDRQDGPRSAIQTMPPPLQAAGPGGQLLANAAAWQACVM